ncbi:MAG: sodium:glutamate symporter [Clostridia bacterium]|jgi:glutamate:Na+ symporter, ESS family|nr:sodium:glutamate symporter [Clostridia bacterium]MBT7121975.1 sodium:glutamate symporter [Clostridia bacterium]
MKKILIIIGSVVLVFAMFILSTLPEIVEASKGLPEEAQISEMVEEVDQDTDWQSVWAPVRQFAYLMVLLGISLIIKANIGFFKKHLVPTTLFGGLLGFVIGQVLWPVFGWEPIFDTSLLQNLVYHAMSVGFIAMALKKRPKKNTENIAVTGFAIINTYTLQAIIGLGAMMLLVLALPQFDNIFGVLLPLSFAQGPGQALSTGKSLQALGMSNGAQAGMALATFGFLWAIVAGIPFMNILRKKYKRKKEDMDELTAEVDPDLSDHTANVPRTLFLDDLTVQIVLIGICFLLTYLFLIGLQAILGKGSTLMTVLWGFQFIWGTLIALLVRMVLNRLQKRKIVKVDYADNYLLQRVASSSFDVMIIASICAISLKTIGEYIVPLLILSTLGGIFTMIYSHKMSKWMYREEKMEHTVALYGMFTGTIVTGMALLKEVDPKGKTSVPESLVLGSGFAAIIGVPLMMILAIPITAWAENKPNLFVVTFALFAVYSIVCFLGVYFTKKIHAKRRAKK